MSADDGVKSPTQIAFGLVLLSIMNLANTSSKRKRFYLCANLVFFIIACGVISLWGFVYTDLFPSPWWPGVVVGVVIIAGAMQWYKEILSPGILTLSCSIWTCCVLSIIVVLSSMTVMCTRTVRIHVPAGKNIAYQVLITESNQIPITGHTSVDDPFVLFEFDKLFTRKEFDIKISGLPTKKITAQSGKRVKLDVPFDFLRPVLVLDPSNLRNRILNYPKIIDINRITPSGQKTQLLYKTNYVGQYILVGDDQRSDDLVPESPSDQIIFIKCVLQEGDFVMIKVENSSGDKLVEHSVEMRCPSPEYPVQREELQ